MLLSRVRARDESTHFVTRTAVDHAAGQRRAVAMWIGVTSPARRELERLSETVSVTLLASNTTVSSA